MDRIEQAIENLLIGSTGGLYSRIEKVSFDVDIMDTQAKCYCYCLKSTANGNLRVKDLVDFVDERLTEYALPKRELDEAKADVIATGSLAKVQRLRKKATSLFTNLKKTGEGGEILLYILAQEILGIPQLISKMSLKTSGALHYNGADGVHVKYDPANRTLNLYWGEAKMYAKINTGIHECFKSLKGFLLDPYSFSSTQQRDLDLITSNITANVNDTELEDFIVRYFDKDDDLSNHLVYKGICFIGYNSDKYPSDLSSKTLDEIKSEIESELASHYQILTTKIKSHAQLDSKEIHVFLMPFPSVEDFRSYYLQTIQQ